MASYVNVDGFQDDHYLARSWTLANMGGNLGGTILRLGLVSLIPIVGPIIALGFIVEWTRQISWGVSCPPGSQAWSWGGYLNSGFRAFVVQLGYGVICGLVIGVAQAIPLIGPIVGSVSPLITIVVSVAIMVASIYAAIYQRLGAGFNFSRIFEMVNHDFVGLARVMGFSLLTATACAIVYGTIIFGAAIANFAATAAQIEALMGTEYNRALFDALMAFVATMIPGLIVSHIIHCFVGSLTMLLSFGMVGLWMRQFDVPHWGREEDPLPPTIQAQRPQGYGYTQAPSAPGNPNQYGQDYQPYGQNYQQYDPYQQSYQPQSYEPPVQTPTWQDMDAQAQEQWQQQYEAAMRRQPAQQPQQQPAQAPVTAFPQEAAPQQPQLQQPQQATPMPGTVEQPPIDGDSAEVPPQQ